MAPSDQSLDALGLMKYVFFVFVLDNRVCTVHGTVDECVSYYY